MDVSDENHICRTCLNCSEGLEPLEEDNGTGLTTRDMLLSFCALHLDDDGTQIPNFICKECSLETLRAYNFKLKCERSDTILRDRAQGLKKESICDMKDGVISLKEESFHVSEIKHESDILTVLNVDIKQESHDEDYQEDADLGNYNEYEISYTRKTKRKRLKRNVDKDEVDDDDDIVLSKYDKKKSKCSKVKDSDDYKEVSKKTGRPGRKKKPRPLSELKLIDDNATSLGYRKIYECPKCHGFFKTFRMLHKHMIKLHQLVLEGVKHFDSLWEAVREQEDIKVPDEKVPALDFNNPRYKCLDCWFLSKSFDTIKKHIISQHRGERYLHCDECDYKTTHLTMLVRHKRLHTGERRFACTECPYRSTSNYQLNLHIAAQHSEHRAFVCDMCAQTFKTKLSLLNHMTRKHINKREHICSICQKGFNMRKDLKNHQLIHLGQRPHVCEHCGMAFTQKANLEKHVRVIHIHSGERPFPCSECNYRGKSIYSLKSHMYKHNRTHHYLCHLCSHKSTTKYALKLHVQRHLGDKSHHCKSCSYSCYDAQTLLVHNRVHTGERPFPCDLCPYRSRTKQRLRNHMKSHLNEQKYSCQHCPYRSNYKSNLIVHLKKNCGRDSRPYTPRKNSQAINFTLLPPEAGGSVTTVDEEQHQRQVASLQLNDTGNNEMKVELNTGNPIVMG